MMSSKSTIESSKNTDSFTQSYNRNQNSNSNWEQDYNGLKQQYDKAMHEFMMLRRQHGEIVQRYDQTRKELEYYRGQNHVMTNQIQQAGQGTSSVCTKQSTEKQVLNRSQQVIPKDDTARSESLNDHSLPYDSKLEDCETLRIKYENLHTTHSAAVDQVIMIKDEINKQLIKKQSNESFKERDLALRERDGLTQQCTAAICQWGLSLQEHNDLQEDIQKVQQQHNKMESVVAYNVKNSKKLNKDLNETHDDVKEYKLIMNERITVHNELDKLSENLSQAYTKNKLLANEINSCRDEKKTLQLHIESLKREIKSALYDRDIALKECNNYRARFGEVLANNESQNEIKCSLDYGSQKEKKYRNDSQVQVVSLDLFNSCQKERMDNLDKANQEIENSQKLANNYYNKLKESLEEEAVSKRRMDCAFNERDKIVLERESLRTLCDNLRKQRDDAVSRLAHAMKDCDDMMKQKNNTAKEFNDYKEKMEVQLERETRLLQLQAIGRFSQDSAIDTDLQDWDIEKLNIDLGVLESNQYLGIDLLGGRDEPLYPNNNAIYLSSVNKGGMAARKLSQYKKSKELDKSGGTWPKARNGPVIEHITGTVLHPHKKKECLPLSMFLDNPQSLSSQNNSKTDTSSVDFSARSGKAGNAGDCLAARPKSHIYGLSSTNDHRYFAPQYSRYSQPSPSINRESMLHCLEPPYNDVSQFHHSHSSSADMQYDRRKTSISYHGDDMPKSHHGYEVDIFPRKRETSRFRLPSNPSVANKSSDGAVGISTGSIDRSVSSERDSQTPTFITDIINPGQMFMLDNKQQSLPAYGLTSRYLKKPLLRGVGSNPLPYKLRTINIEKSVERLGIRILVDNGVFISTVHEHSVAFREGLQVGDQILEVSGVNMRSASHDIAKTVLHQCGNSFTMLVQYCPDKFPDQESANISTSSHSETLTPCNSPTVNRKSIGASVLTSKNSDKNTENKILKIHEPRYLTMDTRKCSDLGIKLVGGNAVGIFVHIVNLNSLAYNAGLQTGDRILEYNKTDLREATAEEAVNELAKPVEKVTVLVQYLIDKYNEIKDKPGDSFFIRALFDRTAELSDTSNNFSQLQFRKNDLLYVDNTMYDIVPGNWQAWLVDQNGCKQQIGIIPSKYKVEEELTIRRSKRELEDNASHTTRRSFFRRKKHQRSFFKELASFSNINMGSYNSDSGTLHDDAIVIASYQRVIKLNSELIMRPVMVVGSLTDCITKKLIVDFPGSFLRYIPEAKQCSEDYMEKGMAENMYLDYRKKGSAYECVTVSGLKEALSKTCHCIIDINLTNFERLHRHNIYPIVLLIKFKTVKHMIEFKDSRSSRDNISAKVAKEMYDQILKLESEYRPYISAVIPAGNNLTYLCKQIKAAIDLEQSKTLWVPYPRPL